MRVEKRRLPSIILVVKPLGIDGNNQSMVVAVRAEQSGVGCRHGADIADCHTPTSATEGPLPYHFLLTYLQQHSSIFATSRCSVKVPITIAKGRS